MAAGEETVCEDLLFRISAKNLLSNTSVKLKINFVPKKEDVDLVWPRGGIKDYLKPESEANIVTLYRRTYGPSDEPQMAKLDLDVKWKAYGQGDFTMSNLASSTDKPGSSTAAHSEAATSTSSKVNAGIKDQRRGGIQIDLKPTATTGNGTTAEPEAEGTVRPNTPT